MHNKEFARRRKRLMARMAERGAAVIPAAPVQPRNRDVEYPYRPDSDFYYLTGFAEPQAVAVLLPGRPQGEYLLFCRERDREWERWNGPLAGLAGACATFGADDAFPIGDLDDILPGLLEGRCSLYYAMGCYADFDLRVLEWMNRLRSRARSGVSPPVEMVALDHLVHEMRLYKSRSEIKAMGQAARISALAHCRVMARCRPGLNEFEIEAELNYAFAREGCRHSAYPAIVAGGGNACVLHYTANADPLRDGDLLLIDAGAEFDYYAGDITRTFPVNGRFSPAQRQVYETVLAAQEAAIAEVKPGNHWNRPHEAAVEALTRGLVAMGLLKGRVKTLISKQAYRPYYMHRTGHWLGMDVHDVGQYQRDGQWRVLEPGMVLTVEPGLYIGAGNRRVARKWWNIGVRIEDDVLVTKDGHRVLSRAVPKAVDEVEQLVGSHYRD